MTTEEKIIKVCDKIKEFLLSKNKSYGDSVMDPLRIFATSEPDEQIRVRIDDKLSRIKRGDLLALTTESYLDTVEDLIGYLILLLVMKEE